MLTKRSPNGTLTQLTIPHSSVEAKTPCRSVFIYDQSMVESVVKYASTGTCQDPQKRM